MDELSNEVILLRIIRSSKIVDLISREGIRSLEYLMLRGRGRRKIGDLTVGEVDSLSRYIDRRKVDKIGRAVQLRDGEVGRDIRECLWIRKKFREIGDCMSKDIREKLRPNEIITSFKIGLELTERTSSTWLYRISKLTSVAHKNVILRAVHGEVYTMDRLSRFGLIDNNQCPRCGEVENLVHKLCECEYVSRIWNWVHRILKTPNDPNRAGTNYQLERILGIHTDPLLLCLHAEIIKRILALPRETNYLIMPKLFAVNAIKALIMREKTGEIKEALKTLLEE
jgi:hypothetical protein